MMKKILLVEDNKSIIQGLQFLLELEYDLTIATSKKEALALFTTRNPVSSFALIIMDIMLGDGSGFEIAATIKNTPILFLTAKDDDESIIQGLDLGEDYLTKPFRSQELLARIRKILLRHHREELICGDARLDLERKELLFKGENIPITSQEFKILELLFTNKNQVITRERMLEVIWDQNENFVNDNTLTVTIKRIRAKLETCYIKTIKGFGYMVDENEL